MNVATKTKAWQRMLSHQAPPPCLILRTLQSVAGEQQAVTDFTGDPSQTN